MRYFVFLFALLPVQAFAQTYHCVIETVCFYNKMCEKAIDRDFFISVIDDETIDLGRLEDTNNKAGYVNVQGGWKLGGTFAFSLKGRAFMFTNKEDGSFIYSTYYYGLSNPAALDLDSYQNGVGKCEVE